MGEGELEVLGDKLLDVRPLDVLGLLELGDAENLRRGSASNGVFSGVLRMGASYVDGPEAGTVAGGHVRVQRLGGVHPRHLTVLLVHVVGAGARVVTDPDAEVLDLLGVLLLDLQSDGN